MLFLAFSARPTRPGLLLLSSVHLEGNNFLVQQDCRYLIIIIAVCK